jgi:hypothetical protein
VIGATVVEASETPTLPDSSHIKEDAYRYRTVLKAFKMAHEDADDNQQLVLLSFLLSVTDYTNDQLNKLISFCTSDEETPIVLSCHQWRKVRLHTVLHGPGGIPDSKPCLLSCTARETRTRLAQTPSKFPRSKLPD